MSASAVATGHPAAQTAKVGGQKFLFHLQLKPYRKCEKVTFLLELLLTSGGGSGAGRGRHLTSMLQ